MHTFKIGDVVHIINQKMSGRFFLEGEAKIIALVDGVDEQYEVEFGHALRPSYRERVERFVDPNAQSDPAAEVARLNVLGTIAV